MLRRAAASLTYANIMSTLAFMLALGGTAWAAATITSGNIKDGTIKARDLGKNSVTSTRIKNGQVKTGDLSTNAVTSGKIKNRQVRGTDIALNAIGSSHIAGNAVTGGDIRNGTIQAQDVAAGTLTVDRMAALPHVWLRSNAAPINAGMDTKLGYQEQYDNFGGFTPGDNFVTVHRAGLWLISANISWNSFAPGDVERIVRILVNDQHVAATGTVFADNVREQSVTRALRLDAGDKISVEVWHDGAGQEDTDGSVDVTMLSP